MNIQEVTKFVENFQGNALAGTIFILYYLIVYWSKIKDGLGLSFGRKINLDQIEKNYQLLKLRIEIEQIKKSSDLDPVLLEKLELEMLERQEDKKGKAFTPVQKFIAIPLLMLTIMLVLNDLQSDNKNPNITAMDTIFGGVFVAITTIVGFWGIPVLQKTKNNFLRKTGFIIFWTFGFYWIAYALMHILVKSVSDAEGLPDSAAGYIFLLSIIISLILGFLNRLPFIRQELTES